jgi:2-phospho-L-lactate guanylyltransferase
MHVALVPVKSLTSAKGRLGASISAVEREALTRAMLADMAEALAAARCVDRTYVLSADAEVLRAAAELGAAPLVEEAGAGGLNRAVAAAAERLAAEGVSRLLIIPGDVPLIEAKEVEAAFSVDAGDWPVVLVPSGSATGTNALLLSPPNVIIPRFEGASLSAHSELCRQLGIPARTLELASFALDVDTPEDLEELSLRGQHRRSGRVVAAKRTAA